MNARTVTRALGVTCALAMGVAGAPSADALSQHHVGKSHSWTRTIDDTVVAPFQLAVNHQNLYATDGFLGTVAKYRNGTKTVLASTGAETDGIDVSPDGRTYAYTGTDAGGAYLQIVGPHSSRRVDLGAYERDHNPDGGVTYGVVAGGNPCADQVFGGLTGGPATYTGIVDSHPYAVAWTGHGTWAVADAAGNDILKVTSDGTISTVALMPRQEVTVTSAMASSLGLPDCVVGVTYAFEPVPTDVEWQNGRMWVSLLPGGPEDASLGARGKVYSVNPWSGRSRQVAGGFLGATNLAVSRNGTIYVAELFGGKITAIRGSHRWTVWSGARPLAVEVHGSSLWFATLGDIDFQTGTVNSNGTIQQIKHVRR